MSQHETKTLTIDDKIGFFLGTIIFFLTLPISMLLSYLPNALIQNYIANRVTSMAVTLAFLSVGAVINLVLSIILGLIASYGLCWVARKLELPQAFKNIGAKHQNPLEAQHYTTVGALLGGAAAMVLFFTKGHTPLNAVTERVEHLFPAPLVMNLGEMVSFNLSHTYAVMTGFLTVGLLFAIGGIALGSFVAAFVERIFTRHTA